MQRLCFFLFSLTCVCFPLGVTIPSRAVYVSHVAREKRNDETTEEERCGTQSPSPGGWGNVCQTGKWGWDFLEFQSEYYFFNGRKPWYISGFFLPIAEIGKFTAMITLHFHLQPQYNMNFIYISQYYFCSIGKTVFESAFSYETELLFWCNNNCKGWVGRLCPNSILFNSIFSF